MRPLHASIVLCTFQAEKYLPEQLASLHAQTRAATEILAQDDGSTDLTVALLRKHPKITVHTNEHRLGFAANFSSAIAKATGDVIFLCDHDDIWENHKVATLLAQFEADPELQVACSEASRIDEASLPLAGLVLGPNGIGEEERERWGDGNALPFLLRRNAVPGMTMAFRSSFRQKFLPVPPGWEHDYWILAVAAALNQPVEIEPRPLVRYRQHSAQVIGGRKTLWARFLKAQTLADRSREAARWDALLPIAIPQNRSAIEGKRSHLQRRGNFPRNRIRRAFAIAAELWRGDYSLFDAGLSSAAKDLLSD
jgi:glycosyltransferase involved in cell wall biosynthesis